MQSTPQLGYYLFQPQEAKYQPAILVHGFAGTGLQMWGTTGWVKRLLSAGIPCAVVDLPHHGQTDLKDDAPAALRTASPSGTIPLGSSPLMQASTEAVLDLAQRLGGAVHLIGFSAGARICYEAATRRPDLTLSLTLGGLPKQDHLGALTSYLEQKLSGSATEVQNLDPAFEAIISESVIAPESLHRFVSGSGEFTFAPHKHHPLCPTLVAVGDQDTIAQNSDWLVEALRQSEVATRYLLLEKRNHVNALTSGIFKKASIELITSIQK